MSGWDGRGGGGEGVDVQIGSRHMSTYRGRLVTVYY